MTTKTLTAEEIKVIEPALITSERYVIKKNKDALRSEIWWHEVWKECKPMISHLVGWSAEKYELSESIHWDVWYRYLRDLAPNCK